MYQQTKQTYFKSKILRSSSVDQCGIINRSVQSFLEETHSLDKRINSFTFQKQDQSDFSALLSLHPLAEVTSKEQILAFEME